MGTSLTTYSERFAEYANEYVENEDRSGGRFISTRGGVLSFQDEQLPGNQMIVVILDSVRENTFFEGRFDPESMTGPKCYAFGRREDEMGPHESMQAHPDTFEPQNDTCAGCPQSEWGSSDTGRGKACQQRRRLALIPAGMFEKGQRRGEWEPMVFDDEAHYRLADMALMKLPVTSVKDYSKYVQSVSASERRPPFGVFTRIWLEPDAKTQYRVCFEMLDVVPDELAEVIMARHAQAREAIVTPYTPMEDDRPAGKGAGAVRGLRKGKR